MNEPKAPALEAEEPAVWANEGGLERMEKARTGYVESPLLTVNAKYTDLFTVPLYRAHPPASHPSLVEAARKGMEALEGAENALMECDRDGDYPLLERIDEATAALRTALSSVPDVQTELSDEEIAELWRTEFVMPAYGEPVTQSPVHRFARAVLSATPTGGGKEQKEGGE
jgi:hypothetical protein